MVTAAAPARQLALADSTGRALRPRIRWGRSCCDRANKTPQSPGSPRANPAAINKQLITATTTMLHMCARLRSPRFMVHNSGIAKTGGALRIRARYGRNTRNWTPSRKTGDRCELCSRPALVFPVRLTTSARRWSSRAPCGPRSAAGSAGFLRRCPGSWNPGPTSPTGCAASSRWRRPIRLPQG